MSHADDTLFAPLEPWREECDEIVCYIENHPMGAETFKSTHRRPRRPPNALFLADLCRLYHRDGHSQFFVVVYRSYRPNGVIPPHAEWFTFDGRLVFGRYEDGAAPFLNTYPPRSIRDLNLVPNEYNDNYVFATEPEANTWMQEITKHDGPDC